MYPAVAATTCTLSPFSKPAEGLLTTRSPDARPLRISTSPEIAVDLHLLEYDVVVAVDDGQLFSLFLEDESIFGNQQRD